MSFWPYIIFQEWELLILSKLGWELSSSTALDYLDHVLPRLYLPLAVDMKKLRRMTESIICYACLDYHFTYKPASLQAASAILYSLQECVRRGGLTSREAEAADKIIREVRTCLQILTHAGGEDLEASLTVLASTMPSHLTASTTSPDSTTAVEANHQLTSTPAKPQQQTPQHLSAVEVFSAEVSSTVASPPQHPHLNTEYLSAVDVFSDFNSSVLEAVLSPNDSFNSILVTWTKRLSPILINSSVVYASSGDVSQSIQLEIIINKMTIILLNHVHPMFINHLT